MAHTCKHIGNLKLTGADLFLANFYSTLSLLFFSLSYVYFNSFCIAFKISISTNIRKKKKNYTRKRGEAQTLLKLFRSYMKPVSFNHVTWNSL